MGRCKALLPLGDGTPFVVACARALRDGGCAPVVVTVPDDDADRAAVIAALRELDVVVARNAEPVTGLSGSIAAAAALVADADADADALVVAPVDAPFFSAALVRALVAAVDTAPAGAAREVVPAAAVPGVVDARGGRRRGHPVLLTRAAWTRLPAFADADGPRALLQSLGASLVEVAVDDERVADDVDTPRDYDRLVR